VILVVFKLSYTELNNNKFKLTFETNQDKHLAQKHNINLCWLKNLGVLEPLDLSDLK
jgi:uncharacterized protein with NRDE domain